MCKRSGERRVTWDLWCSGEEAKGAKYTNKKGKKKWLADGRQTSTWKARLKWAASWASSTVSELICKHDFPVGCVSRTTLTVLFSEVLFEQESVWISHNKPQCPTCGLTFRKTNSKACYWGFLMKVYLNSDSLDLMRTSFFVSYLYQWRLIFICSHADVPGLNRMNRHKGQGGHDSKYLEKCVLELGSGWRVKETQSENR